MRYLEVFVCRSCFLRFLMVFRIARPSIGLGLCGPNRVFRFRKGRPENPTKRLFQGPFGRRFASKSETPMLAEIRVVCRVQNNGLGTNLSEIWDPLGDPFSALCDNSALFLRRVFSSSFVCFWGGVGVGVWPQLGLRICKVCPKSHHARLP